MKIRNFKDLFISYAQIFIVIVLCSLVIIYEVYHRQVQMTLPKKAIENLSVCRQPFDCGSNFICKNEKCRCMDTQFWVIDCYYFRR
jgi:hypothetical protein